MWPLLLITIVTSILTALLSPTQKAKRGNLKDFSFPQINDGDPIQYIAGTVKITAPGLVWYGDYSSKAIKKSTGLFTKSTVGYKYFLGWQLVFSIGPNVKLNKLWFGTKSGTDEENAEENDPNFTDPNDPKVPTPILSGSYSTGTFHLKDDNYFGGDTGGGGYDLNLEFYGGEQTQGASSYLRSKIIGFVPPYRGVCYLVAHGYIGNATSLQTMNAELTRIPDPLGLGALAMIGSQMDANPANVLFDLMTNNFGAASVPVSRMNADSFIQCGVTLFNEDEAISIASGSSAGELSAVIQDILKQIEGTMYEDPTTGLICLKLIRADYVIADLLEINESNIISVSNYAVNLWSDTKNRVRIKFQDRLKDYNDRVAFGDDGANISFQGGQVKAILIDQPYIKRRDHANRKVAEALATYSTPLTKMSVRTQRISTSLRPGTPIKLRYAPYNVDQVVFRITKVNYGDLLNNYLALELGADKFAKTDALFAAPITNFSRPFTGAASVVAYTLDETPRWFNIVQTSVSNPDAARIMVYPFRPNDAQQSFNLWAKTQAESDYVQTNFNQDFSNFAATNDPIPATGGVGDVVLQAITDADVLNTVSVDQIKASGLNLIQIDDEIMAYESYSLNTDSLYTLENVHRGLLDTVRSDHAAGSIVTFLDPSQVMQREFSGTDTVDVKIGSTAATGAQDTDTASTVIVTLQNRAARPLPPVGFTLDGVYENPAVDNSNGVQAVWKRRDRLKTTISFEGDPNEVPEQGTEYFVTYGANGSTKTVSLGTGTSGTFTFDLQGENTVEFFARLNGLDSTHIAFDTNVAHAAGISVVVDLATATTGFLTSTQVSDFDGLLGTATTSAPTASVIVNGSTSSPSSLDDGNGGFLDDGSGNPLETD